MGFVLLLGMDVLALGVQADMNGRLTMLSASVSGVLATVSLALFAGRLESRYLDCRWLFLMGMFLYSGVQLFYPVLRIKPFTGDGYAVQADVIRVGLKLFGLAMKIWLYFTMARLFRSGQIAFLIHELRDERVRAAVAKRRADFCREYQAKFATL